MRLSEVSENHTVVISKVMGHGAFRRRITEMGFVRGKEVKVLKNAPLRDPVEYQVMGYHVSLRREEAHLIEVVSPEEAIHHIEQTYDGTIDLETLKTSARVKGKEINIALAGNPNCGKTSLFNRASGAKEHVGNYSGVTIDAAKANLHWKGYSLTLIDLPGTYSLTAYTPEELYARKYIIDETPDIVVNVVDASNLERNLYLTTQLIDMDIKVVLALNMYDELVAGGAKLDIEKLGKLLGIPIIPTMANKGIGIDKLLNKVIDVYEDRDPIVRHIHINYGAEMEKSIKALQKVIREGRPAPARASSRYLSLRLLDKDVETAKIIDDFPNAEQIKQTAEKEINRLEERLDNESSNLITDAKYGFIAGALKESYSEGVRRRHAITEQIDKLATHKIYGFPLFLLFMMATFSATFTLGAYPMDWINAGIAWIGDLIRNNMANGMLKDLLINGIINGVGSVIVFLPNILILFFFLSFMEDTGYMARAAFIMDKLMHKIGLHGRSFIPMVMGFGCNVPAIMATRTLRNRNDRLLTMLIIPFMSCSARLPVYIVLISAFFGKYPGLVLMGLYLLGILLAVGTAKLFNRTIFKRKETPFVMELPPYRMPTLKNTVLHMWEKGSQYLKKIGGTILVAVIAIWALEYFPRTSPNTEHFIQQKQEASTLYQSEIAAHPKQADLLMTRRDSVLLHLTMAEESSRIENSYIGRMGKAIEPAIRPLGFDWRMGVSLLAGLPAKEIVVSTMAILFQVNDDPENRHLLQEKLQTERYTSGPNTGKPLFTPLVALSFLIFVLIYFPCIAVIATIRRESGSWKWALLTVVYTTGLAWFMAFLVYQLGTLITG
ncbi:ferrous iron transport protein B [Prolixibacter sp. SD074]|jgi:ferrous iron transport protein B|uniref:ferrous iron transport protein B n=1 Tax=Prolixibacter sp. SD074 TaxID=2652391 RepID=UPI00127F9DC6|nr:ferrous iron transport protein B [Prolixibacter sp. SD074]GET29552.1 ferrous iron transport protein B [Prolixibacter sp. SD074]